MPTMLLIDDMHFMNNSTVSEVNPPTIGIKLLIEKDMKEEVKNNETYHKSR